MKKTISVLCLFIGMLIVNNAIAQPQSQQCQSKKGVTAYISVFDGNTCAGYFNNSNNYAVEVNWTITGIDKETGQRVEVGGEDYRDRSYSITFDLCD